jgi:hypothetical protein
MLRLLGTSISTAQLTDRRRQLSLDIVAGVATPGCQSTPKFTSRRHHKIVCHLFTNDGAGKKFRPRMAGFDESILTYRREAFVT